MHFTRRFGRVAVAAGLAVAIAAGALATASAAPPATTTYDSIGPTIPGNVLSWGYQANQTAELGDLVTLAAGPRALQSVTVLLSSWGCQDGAWFSSDCMTTPGSTFSHPLTLNVYAVDNTNPLIPQDGALLATSTATFNIPFRPSVDTVNCTGGRWYSASEATCYNGLANTVTFNFPSTTVLPNDVIWTLAFDTTSYGAAPIGTGAACFSTNEGCGYDSLNLGLDDDPAPPAVGSEDPNQGFLNTLTPSNYCDGGAGGVGILRNDNGPGCWLGFRPMARINTSAVAVGPPTNQDQCKKDGWKAFNNPAFKNQGDCVSYVSTKGKNPGKG